MHLTIITNRKQQIDNPCTNKNKNSFILFLAQARTETKNEGCCLLPFDAFPTLQAWLNERQMCLISQAAGAVKWLVLAAGSISSGGP